jgi:hypothetical protein
MNENHSMRLWRTMKAAHRDVSGGTAIEFAIVAGIFFTLMFGIIEYGMIMLTKVAIESATVQVGRASSLGNVGAGCAAGDRVCEVKRVVIEKTQGLIDPESVNVSAVVVSSATTSTPRTPDICLDNAATPYPAACSAWQENGGNPTSYDPPAALGGAALGNGGELVEVRVTYLWRVLFPIFRSQFGKNGVLTITSSTVVKNEPF